MIFPRRVMVCKTGSRPVPFKFLVWLAYKMALPRDITFVDEVAAGEAGAGGDGEGEGSDEEEDGEGEDDGAA